MKKMNLMLLAVIFLLSMAACSRIAEEDIQTLPEQFLTATLEGNADTKTQLGGPENGIYYPYWSEKDQVAVFADDINIADKYTLVGGAGTGKGLFKGVLTGSKMVGLYPYSVLAEEGLKDNVLHLELPSVQQYAAGSFGPGAYPMLAVGSADNLTFKNLCAVLKVSMTGEEAIQSIRFVAHDEWLCVSGPATVRTDFGSNPELIMADDGASDVTLQCNFVQLDPTSPTDFYLVIPAGTYQGGFSVEIKTFKGIVKRSTNADITFERSQLRAIPVFECVADGEIDPDNIPYNQIWYAGSYKISLNASSFDQSVLSHQFENGKGIITFAGPITSLGIDAFYYKQLTEIHLPDCVETIGDYAFQRNYNLTTFRTPASLSSVGYLVFDECSNLSGFTGKHATDDGAFILLENGTLAARAPLAMKPTLTLPSETLVLGPNLFWYDKIIREVTIPEGVTTLGTQCFAYCSALETVALPSTLSKLNASVFEQCPNLTSFQGNNAMIWDDGRCLVDASGKLYAFAGKGVVDFVMPEGIVAPMAGSVNGQSELCSITFPSTMYDMYGNWLSNCPNLEFLYGNSNYFLISEDHHCEVFLNNGGNYLCVVTPKCPAHYSVPSDMNIGTIWSYALRSNTSIQELTFPEGVTTLQGINYMSNLVTLHLPSTLTTIGQNAFSGCKKLDVIYLKSQVPPSYSEYSDYYFLGHDGMVIYVPEGYEEIYKTASGWSKYADYIQGYHYDDLPEPDYYISSDYSRDGKVTTRQTATDGAGINVVFMGDAFSDRQIADGTYDAVMDKMIDAFFSEEPYTTCRNMFNVYTVDVVSSTEGYDHAGQALGGWFGSGTSVGGDDNKCMEYALSAVTSDQLSSTLIIVAMNREYYAGTCWMYYASKGDYGDGVSVAYFPLGTDDEVLAQLVRHEAGGHGFSKLADEYAYESMGTMPQSEIDDRKQMEAYGWWKNCDFTGDPEEVKWARFLSDERYKYDGLGCFEGAFTYWKGAWRPTDNSIMRYNTGGFNAPSRESIWYRIHKLAYGDSWQYDYEEFVAYDAVNRKTASSASVSGQGVQPHLPPLHAPVVVPMTWQEAMQKAKAASVKPARKQMVAQDAPRYEAEAFTAQSFLESIR